MFTDKFPSTNYASFLPVIVLIIIAVGSLMFLTWGTKRNENTSIPPAAGLGREDEDLPAGEAGTSTRESEVGRKDEGRKEESVVKDLQPFPIYDFSLKKEDIPAVGTGIASGWEDLDDETDPDAKALADIKKEAVEPLLGFRTESLANIVRKQKADALLKSSPKEESKRKIPLDAVE